MQQQWTKPKLPKKKGALCFFLETRFWPKTTFKNTNFAPPPENCAQKISKKPYFYRLKKRWPSYWLYHGQVIDPKMAKTWPSYWPYSAYIYIYMWCYCLVQALAFPELRAPTHFKLISGPSSSGHFPEFWSVGGLCKSTTSFFGGYTYRADKKLTTSEFMLSVHQGVTFLAGSLRWTKRWKIKQGPKAVWELCKKRAWVSVKETVWLEKC